MNKQQRRAIALDIAASLVMSATQNDGALAIVFSEHPNISQNDANKVLEELVAIAHQLQAKLKFLPDVSTLDK